MNDDVEYSWEEDSGTGRPLPEIPELVERTRPTVLDMPQATALAQTLLNIRQQFGPQRLAEILEAVADWNQWDDTSPEVEGGQLARLSHAIKDAPIIYRLFNAKPAP